ncbi:DEAD/DEAH box helicase family protein [Dermacoccus sp. Tok2021]|uniref:DEAD/DEAH box helicase family protein n=1 Tax=Dermacoccus sp. Tok2021 TaxID=2826873 RepID=UPI001CA62389|nr:DEAD/DEAH box helicase family protein [Dermacoccus sp. Tok2021]MBZ4498448.1 DEAD/DEAH box helicase family protein [Dermacoccus sp. Tok2021]
MGNFDFIKAEWSQVYEDCAKAESYLTNDPRSACFYARRSIEVLVHHLYDLAALKSPVHDDLSGHITSSQFKNLAGQGIVNKLMLIKNMGNNAVHKTQPIPITTATQVLNELFHVVVWAAFRYSTTPNSVPTGLQFDPKLAAQSAPLSHAEVVKLAEKFQHQDAAHAAALAEKDDLLAQHEAEIEKLRAQVKAAQAAKTLKDDHDYREDETRDAFIDLLLHEAGWPLEAKDDREYEIMGMPSKTGKGFVDYVLWGDDGRPLAVVEAKRTRRSPNEGQEQARLYANVLEAQFGRRPIIFFTNGYEHYLWDDAPEIGYPPRRVSGFYTRAELMRLIERRGTRRPLADEPVDTDIAGRHYQVRAIRAVDDALQRCERAALLVMATGTGKTRTTAAIIKQLMDGGWAKNVLFLADRTALVKQAKKTFTALLPNDPVVNLVEERNGQGRIYVSTYQTMMGLTQQLNADGTRRFGAGHFDLIVIDEAHRSVYAKYGYLFDHFDSLLLGLTATPKDEVDHNTYRLFQLDDGTPTDAYTLDAAIKDGYLVPPNGIPVGTTFLQRGIRYEDLSADEKDAWDLIDWGEDGPPDGVEADDINRFLFNADTVDKVLAMVMERGHKVAGGDRIAKTIIFAKSQRHADFIAARFDAQWPALAGTYARVITHGVSYADTLIENFGNPESAPHIAISVDMLDTGIDVPDVANLVFFKPVRSRTKFWQMIGRGTRLRPGLYGEGADKEDFFVFDFCGNLEFFSADPATNDGSTQKSLTQRIVENRVALVRGLDASRGEGELRRSTADALHEFVTGMTLDNVLVRPHRRLVEKFTAREAWESLDEVAAAEAVSLAGLPSTVGMGKEPAKRFDLLILRRQVADLDGDAATAERMRETIQAIAHNLLGKLSIPLVAAQTERLEDVASDEWWVDVTLPMLELVRLRLRELAAFVTSEGGKNPVYTDFEDTWIEPSDVTLPIVTPGLNWERFREKATAYLRDHESDVALQKLRRNKQLTETDLGALETMLVEAGAEPSHLERAKIDTGGLGLFVRSLVGLDRAAAMEVFKDFLDGTRYTADQVSFIESIITELTANGVMPPGRLYESPFTDDLPRGPDMIFPDKDVTVIVETLKSVREHALVESHPA